MITGSFLAKNLVTQAETDLLIQLKTIISQKIDITGKIIFYKKLTLMADAELNIDINSTGIYSDMFFDITDSLYKVSLAENDVLVRNLLTLQAGVNVWVAGIYGTANS